jgi:hypothetical protein
MSEKSERHSFASRLQLSYGNVVFYPVGKAAERKKKVYTIISEFWFFGGPGV